MFGYFKGFAISSKGLQSLFFWSKLIRNIMKMIKCYIRHEKLEAVRLKLFELGVPGLSVIEIKGIGKPLSQLI